MGEKQMLLWFKAKEMCGEMMKNKQWWKHNNECPDGGKSLFWKKFIDPLYIDILSGEKSKFHFLSQDHLCCIYNGVYSDSVILFMISERSYSKYILLLLLFHFIWFYFFSANMLYISLVLVRNFASYHGTVATLAWQCNMWWFTKCLNENLAVVKDNS